MGNHKNRYREMERIMSLVLAADLFLFILYLIASGCGVVWLKVVLAIVAILLSGLCLLFLYFSKELLRSRSLWMSVSAASIILCILFSLILNFPSPNPYKQKTVSTAYSISDTI